MPSPTILQPSPHVLIIGAGISGLALAHGLQKHGISFHLYERDHNQNYRAQGYRLRIAADAVAALEHLLPTKVWNTFEMTCGEMRFRSSIPSIDAETGAVGLSGRSIEQDPSKPQPRTVDRTVFRDVLLRGLPEDSVTYGKSFDRYEETPSGVQVFFADGSHVDGTLLVGADGTRSRVRRQFLPDMKVLDTGARCIYGKTPLTPELARNLTPELMGGISGIRDRSNEYIMSMVVEPIIFPNREQMMHQGIVAPHDYLYWVLVARPQVMGLPEVGDPHLTAAESEDLALKVTNAWHPSVRAIIEAQRRGETATLTMSSVGSDLDLWKPQEHVTLIGDAVHPMVAAGSGAIVALQDAHTLCQLLVEEGHGAVAIGKYEEKMRVYAGKSVAMSWEAGKVIFGQKSDDERPIGEMMEEIRAKRIK